MYKPFPLNNQYLVSSSGKILSQVTDRFIGTNKDAYGYHRFSCMIDGKYKHIPVHRAVAITWIDNPDNLPSVNHKDGDKTNNSVGNLEWCTDVHNKRHAKELGLIARGSKHWSTKLTDEVVNAICEMFAYGYTTGEVVKAFNVPRGTALNIRARRTWTHISERYKWDKNVKYRNQRAETIETTA